MANAVRSPQDHAPAAPIVSPTGAQAVMSMLMGLVQSIRPKQAAKNGLLLVPLVFSVNKWWEPTDVSGMAIVTGKALAGFALFAALSGAVYLVNDLLDVERDRAHPVKRNRPIAAGKLPVSVAWGAAAVICAGTLALSFLLQPAFGFAALGYAVLNFAYSLVVKHIVILDVMSVAAGFVTRAVAGSFAIDRSTMRPDSGEFVLDITISPWLYVVTALGALFIALAKRRSELAAAGEKSAEQRTALSEYTVGLLDQLTAIVAPATLLAYTLYTFSGEAFGEPNIPANGSMMLTVPFVAYGLFRYLYLVHKRNLGEAPEEVLLNDRPFLVNGVLWLLTAAGVLLVNRLSM